MNILYAGTPSSSARILRFLAEMKPFNIKGVLTQPDKKGKRGNNLLESPVAIAAKDLKLEVFKHENLNSKEALNSLGLLDIDFLVVIAYGKIIPPWLLELPSESSINIHFSLLPKYRGASPIQSALLNGDDTSGISIIKMSEDLDSGDIISSFIVRIKPEDNKSTLENKLTNKCIIELPRTLELVKANKIEAKKQDHSSASYCKKITKSDSIIDFNETTINIINKFRAFYGWPGTSFIYNDIQIKIHNMVEAKIINRGKPGTIYKLNNDGLYINTIDSMIVITHLQFPNKNIISSNDVFNSYKDFFHKDKFLQ